jgi:hypothetical protein
MTTTASGILPARITGSRTDTPHANPPRVHLRCFLRNHLAAVYALALTIGSVLAVTVAFVRPVARDDAVPAALRWGSKLIAGHAPQSQHTSSPDGVTIIIGLRN